jgi:cobalamin biosynthesis protein CobT
MSTEQTVKQTDWEDNQEDEEVHEDEEETEEVHEDENEDEEEEVHEDENEDEEEDVHEDEVEGTEIFLVQIEGLDHEVMFYAKTFDTAYEQAVKYLNNLSMVIPERVYYLDKRDTEIDLVSVSRLWFMSVERTEATATIREVRQSR